MTDKNKFGFEISTWVTLVHLETGLKDRNVPRIT